MTDAPIPWMTDARRQALIRTFKAGGYTYAQAAEAVDLAVHAVQEADATFLRIVERAGSAAVCTQALVLGMQLLEDIMQSRIKVATALAGSAAHFSEPL